ncbi:hypothetical protein HYALB_00006680 [Hymenoscyphus albidus]|uniref:Uncharacterized protein n=1 Tax=Hymenoscyphus albidus TaxID=595503 RepID=A0A9N9Q4Z2_9HELO|nr:hypothetical protein HYALB_00006680 [Hymenoscyphus albidus]
MSAEHPLAEAATNTECLFFTKFPIEIRRKYIASSFRVQGSSSHRSRALEIIAAKTSRKLLLACHQTYNGGRTIFYEEVVIYTDASQCEGVKLVCENLSEFAKLHIQHFRSFVLGDGVNAILPLFDDLPKLKTCQIYLKGCMFDLKPAKFDECSADTFVERFQELFSGTSISSQNFF